MNVEIPQIVEEKLGTPIESVRIVNKTNIEEIFNDLSASSFKEITNEKILVDTDSLSSFSTVVPILLADTNVNKIGR